jgi:hypothetical protein
LDTERQTARTLGKYQKHIGTEKPVTNPNNDPIENLLQESFLGPVADDDFSMQVGTCIKSGFSRLIFGL